MRAVLQERAGAVGHEDRQGHGLGRTTSETMSRAGDELAAEDVTVIIASQLAAALRTHISP
jgi:hypothetical protein